MTPGYWSSGRKFSLAVLAGCVLGVAGWAVWYAGWGVR